MIKLTYIISDIHLNKKNEKSLVAFTEFLKKISRYSAQLFILGDLFDHWIGDDDTRPFNRSIINLLRTTSSTIPIYFMHGNRDFLIGSDFANATNVKIINDPYILNFKNHIAILTHGDLLCTKDCSYQLFRKIIRNRYIIKIYLSLPIKLRIKISNLIRSVSTRKNKKYKIIDVTNEGIEKYRKNKSIIIHGHTHLFGTHSNKNYTRHVLGSWHKNISYLKISDNHIELKKCDFSSIEV